MNRFLMRALAAPALLCVASLAFAQSGTPDAFSFVARSNVPTSTLITSEAATITGGSTSYGVSVAGAGNPQYSVNGGAFTNDVGSIDGGQTLRIRHLSAAAVSATTTSSVTVGSSTASFVSTTAADDRTPDAFGFGTKGNVPADTDIDSPPITLSGYTAPAGIQPGPGLAYRVGNGEFVTSSGSLPVGATLTVRLHSSASRLGYAKSYIKVGGVSGAFITRTLGSIAPAAVDDAYSVDQDKVLSIFAPGVLANDTSSVPLTAAVANAPGMGTVALAADGSFVYTPRAGFVGFDQFTYTTSDGGSSRSAPAKVSINVKLRPAPVRITVKQFGGGTPGRTFSISSTPLGACSTITPNVAFDCAVGTNVTITAAAAPAGSYFAGWFDAPECAALTLDGGTTAAKPYRLDCSFKALTNRTISAAFATTPTASPTSEADAQTCDVTVSQHCFFPFPNNVFTKAKGALDVSSFTGLQVNLMTAGHFPNASTTGTPAAGKTLDATEWNRDDGFPQGPKLVTYINISSASGTNVGADENALDATGVTHLVDLSRSELASSPTQILDATPKVDANNNPCTTGAGCVDNPEYLKPVMHWVEPELPKRELRDTDGNGMMDTRLIPDAERALTIRLGKNLAYRHRYVVAVRRFKRADGSFIEAEPNFRIYRDNQTLGATFPTMTARRPAMESIFATLAAAGIARNELNQAWDFTVISQENLHERLLAMRDTATAALGTSVPCYTVESFPNASDPAAPAFGFVSPPYTSGSCAAGALPAAVTNNTGITNKATGDIARQVDGTVAVPCYMTNNCAPGSKLNYTPSAANPVFGDNKPDVVPGSFLKANWECVIPRSATAANPARISLYGHGLLGSLGEVRSGHVAKMANENNIVFCAMNWTGFATEDAGSVAAVSADVSAFAPFIDRQLEGHLAWLIFQELIVRPGGFINHPAFRTNLGCTPPATSCPLYRTEFDADGNGGMFYDGNSQGGIMAGAVVAISKRITHAVLGVPGMNYSILLRRSSDYQVQNGENPGVGATGVNYVLQQNYPNDLDLAFIYALTPMVWERTENSGYAVNMTDNPVRTTPPTPKHKILLTGGYGDHQVTMWTNDILARSAGMSVIKGMTDPARYALFDPHSGSKYGVQRPLYGIPEITSFPFNGSAWTLWDSGRAAIDNPPLYNAPPRTNQDPHEHVRRAPDARAMKSAFMHSDTNGAAVINSCSHDSSKPLEGPCSSANHD